MKLVKSLLLGSAAGLAAVTGAQAADLPVRRAEPAVAVDYVRVCSTYGAGFFYIPGSSDTCLRIGGRVRADLLYAEPFTRADNALQLFTRGRIQVDARTATSYGLLRTFLRYELNITGGAATSPNLAQAFIQFGGLTAGRVTSFFSNADLPTQHMGTLRFDDAPDVQVLAYTFQMGGGISATLALEEGQNRRTFGFANASNIVGGGAVVVDPATGLVVFQNPYAVVPGGQTVPDIVGNIRAAGTWGSVQLSGAVHQVRDVGAVRTAVPVGAPPPAVPATLPLFADSEYGWAIGLSGHLTVPWFGQGDAVWAFGTFSSGAPSYSGFGSNIGLGTRNAGVVDAVVNPANGDLEKTDVFNIAAGFTHYWTPQFRSSVFGSYAKVEFGGNASVLAPAGLVAPGGIVIPAGTGLGFVDFNEWRIGANSFWSPVSGLNIGVEVLYAEADFDQRVFSTRGGAVFNEPRLSSDVGAIEGRLRIQRDF
jgi:Porin subfamily